jgi:hypothetical protein
LVPRCIKEEMPDGKDNKDLKFLLSIIAILLTFIVVILLVFVIMYAFRAGQNRAEFNGIEGFKHPRSSNVIDHPRIQTKLNAPREAIIPKTRNLPGLDAPRLEGAAETDVTYVVKDDIPDELSDDTFVYKVDGLNKEKTNIPADEATKKNICPQKNHFGHLEMYYESLEDDKEYIDAELEAEEFSYQSQHSF